MIIVLVDLATDNDNNTKSVNNGYTDSQTYVCIYIYMCLCKYIIYIRSNDNNTNNIAYYSSSVARVITIRNSTNNPDNSTKHEQ